MKNELNEKELAKVSGGSGMEHQIRIDIEIPYCGGDAIIEVYIDGEIDMSKTVGVDTNFVTHRAFIFRGSGIHQVRFKINNETVYCYEINFDEGVATRTY